MPLCNSISLMLLALGVLAVRVPGGPVGMGLAAGLILGAALSGFGVAAQRRLVATNAAYVLPALAGSFMLKMVALFVATFVFLRFPSVAQRFDPMVAMLAFALSAMLVLLVGTIEISRLLRRSSPQTRVELPGDLTRASS